MMKKSIIHAATAVLLGSVVVGCESHAGTGALVGGAAGAGIGAIIGHNSHGRTAGGALIGGAVGAAAGGLIGNEQDKAEARARDRYYDRRDSDYDRGYRSSRESDRYYEEHDARSAPPPADDRYADSDRHYDDQR